MPAVYSFSTNRPTTGDNEFSLLAKLALTYGLSPTTSDNEFSLLAKLAVAIGTGVTPTPDPEPPSINIVGSGTGIGADMDSFERAGAAGYTGNGDAAANQREAATDVYRIHYEGGTGEARLRLEDDPTECSLICAAVPVVTPGELKFSAVLTGPVVTASRLRIEYRIDAGSPVSNGTSLTLTDVATSPGDHTLGVRAVSTSGVDGPWVTSASFTVTGFSPVTIPGLILWLDADTISGSDEDPVETWADLSDEENDAAQATLGNRPSLQTAAINGRKAVQFSADHYLDGVIDIPGEEFTAFVVWSLGASSASYARALSFSYGGVGDAGAAESSAVALRNAAAEEVASFRASLIGASAVTYDTFFLQTIVYDGVDGHVYINDGAAASTASTGTFTITKYRLGANIGSPTDGPLEGMVANVIVYDSALDTTDRETIRDYLMSIFAL